MALRTHRAERTDLLADALGELLAVPLDDPFAQELVVVPARGVERWLTQRLSHRLGQGPAGGDGVCAGIRFLTPWSLASLLLDRERDDPWDPDRLVWPVLDAVDAALGRPGFEALTAHLGHAGLDDRDELRRSRRWAVARRLAGLFSSYAAQRPGMVADWRAGGSGDGLGGTVDEDLAWQPVLWRDVLARVGEPAPDERLAATVEALRSGTGLDRLDLPPRLHLFGHTRLPAAEARLLRALAEQRDVHLWLPQTSTSLWEALAGTAEEGPVPRVDDVSARLVAHPLLAALGRDARELRRTLGPVDSDDVAAAPEERTTLLGMLQADLRADRVPTPDERRARRVPLADRTVQVHSCHGAARQVEVLREVLVGLLQDDPTLEPRDVLVMCPDVEAYAPLFSAAFGLADVVPEGGHPAHLLRVRLADRGPVVTNPLLALAARLVDLAGGRVTATDVLDLVGSEGVRRRFRLDDDELDRVAGWVRGSGVRWGLDADHRGDFGLLVDDGTWVVGLRRALLGAAVAADGPRHVGGVLPLDDVGDGDLDLLGRVGELLARLHDFVDAARRARSVADWADALREAVLGLATTAPEDAWQVAQLDRELARLGGPSGADEAAGPVLRHADVRALLRHRLGGRPTRSGFRTGTLTVCTMVPMRSVPHRVVALVGLDDGTFPRTTTRDGDDVLARRPVTGERDPRAEDRQLLLDAVGAATGTLVVTYTGRGEHTGAARPPAVPLGELLDALDATAVGEDGGPVLQQVVVAHPLQPHDDRALAAGALVPGSSGAFSFDRTALDGAVAARSARPRPPVLVTDPLPPPDRTADVRGAGSAGDVELADLHDFLAHPVRHFFRHRLRVSTPRERDEVPDALPLDLGPLEKWAVGDRFVGQVLEGRDAYEVEAGLLRTGSLPPGRLGERTVDALRAEVRPLVRQALGLRRGSPRSVDVDVDLGDGRRVVGTVSGVWGNDLVTVRYSRLAPKHRLQAWLDALALAAGHPDENWTAHTVGKHRAGAQRALLRPLDDRATGWLRDLTDLRERALRAPLPLPVRTAAAWAEGHALTRRGGGPDDPEDAARKAWETPRWRQVQVPTEDADAWHVLAFGARASYDDLLAAPVRGDDPPPWGLPDEPATPAPHRLGLYAWRLWGPLLTEDREQVGTL